jgi:uncharacterized protein (TIGR04222 family)
MDRTCPATLGPAHDRINLFQRARPLVWALGLVVLLAADPVRAGPPNNPKPGQPAPAARNENDILDPFDFSGPHFLGFYLELAVILVIGATLLRRYLRQPADEASPEADDLTPYEVAYLAGEKSLAVNAAIAHLVQQGALAVNPAEHKLSVSEPLPVGANNLERAVYAAATTTGGETIRNVHATATQEADKLGGRLKELGLVVEDSQARWARWLPLLLMLSLLLFGVIKIGVGVARHKPVGFLVAASVGTLVISLVGFARHVHRSRRGDRVLAQMRKDNAALQTAAGRNAKQLAAPDLTLALGLFGMAILASGPLADLHTALRPPAGSSGCGSGCGGGGCGGGGCGGGGCGGCGG